MACLLLAESAYGYSRARLPRLATSASRKIAYRTAFPGSPPDLTPTNLNLNRNRPQLVVETGSATFRTGGSDHADAVRSVRTTPGISARHRRVPVQRLARVGAERRWRLSPD